MLQGQSRSVYAPQISVVLTRHRWHRQATTSAQRESPETDRANESSRSAT